MALEQVVASGVVSSKEMLAIARVEQVARAPARCRQGPASASSEGMAQAGEIEKMNSTPPVPSLVVVYAQDIERVAEFYHKTLSRPVIEQEARFIIVGDVGLEVAIVRMSEALAKETPVSAPPRVRKDTALKPSFLVEDFHHVHAEAMATGGGTKPVNAAWEWRGQLHLDGYDPEGNVVQFRKRV